MELEERHLNSTIRLLERINDEPLWQDLRAHLEDAVSTAITEIKTAQTMVDVAREQAIIAVCEDILELPEIWRELLVFEKQQEEQNA